MISGMLLAGKAWFAGNLTWIFLGVVVSLGSAFLITKYQLANARTELAEYKNGYLILAQAAKDCTASVSAFEESEDKLAKAANAALNEAIVARDALKKRASILALSSQPNYKSDCDATQDLINSNLPNLH